MHNTCKHYRDDLKGKRMLVSQKATVINLLDVINIVQTCVINTTI